jgi:hypothetical protein
MNRTRAGVESVRAAARCTATAVLLLVSGCVQAQESAPAEVAASVQVLHRRLVERADNGARLVTESGELLRLQGEATHALANGGAVCATAAAAAGALAYHGHTQAGVPLDSDVAHRELAIGIGWRPVDRASWGEGWLTLDALQQRRQIASTGSAQGLRETSALLMAGLRWSHVVAAAGWQWRPSLQLRASVVHRVDVDFGGLFDPAQLTGGARRELVLGFDGARPGSPWQWGLAWSHARQRASGMQPLTRGGASVGTVRQPRIDIDDLALHLTRAF